MKTGLHNISASSGPTTVRNLRKLDDSDDEFEKLIRESIVKDQ